jgi:hypothetical protein
VFGIKLKLATTTLAKGQRSNEVIAWPGKGGAGELTRRTARAATLSGID